MMTACQAMPLASPWHQELEAILQCLEDAPLECDGMTYALSFVLSRAGIKHQCKMGYVRDTQTGYCVTPHLWIELADGWFVDFRLRMWLGDDDRIPHGVFSAQDAKDFEYQGQPKGRANTISDQVLDIMTEGKLSHVKVPDQFVKENPDVCV